MRLILVRHAKAEDREQWKGEDDLKRPLTQKGKKQAKKIAKYLYKRYPEVDAVISSLALRACDTAKYIAKLQKNSTFFLSPHLNPEVGIEGYTKHQNEIEEDWQTLVVVGHEPAISEFVKSICSKGNLNIKIHKGGVVELEHEGNENWALVGLRNF
ncbi:phosphohistidine phosphatase SixA [Helicobacter colisuis]|uniref:Phosphohistidine phosphatase SixA n=1 Tax=Helicobacter colisuis TaxID=2949739 RepID=A0ABT0TUU8_9HELI|nr:phosphohistidine phosphatase SixA [Helicobacter colisuis]MCL9819694.1 phosphohistidine phosphatase SixA [Helicobacter colisuis]